MIRDFSREELEPVASGNDTELTLGGGTLLVLACGLLMLCGVCFALGYAVGHRSSADQVASTVMPQSISDPGPSATGSGVKPGAAAVAPSQPQTQSVDGVNGQAAESTDTAQAVAIAGASSAQSQAIAAPVSQVRPALGSQAGAAQPAETLKVQPATAQVQGWMVQIAAVSHSEDAQVLVDALRKRGYEVTARRDLGDNLIHVQTGPFINRNDANAMRTKLLSDGYNAIVQ